MKYRPWPLIAVAIMQFLTPVANVLISAYLMHMSVGTYLMTFLAEKQWFEILEFFGVYLIAGGAILAVKSWSYPVFLTVVTWNLFQIFKSWSDFPGVISLGTVLTLYAANMAVVAYFLLPAVRKAYFDRSVRWWENQPRYSIQFDATMESARGIFQCAVTDFSRGGLFFKSSQVLSLGDLVRIKALVLENEFEASGRVVHQRPGPTGGYGIQFRNVDAQLKSKVKSLIHAMETLKLPRRPERRELLKSFNEWMLEVIRGKGLVPEIHNRAASQASSSSLQTTPHPAGVLNNTASLDAYRIKKVSKSKSKVKRTKKRKSRQASRAA